VIDVGLFVLLIIGSLLYLKSIIDIRVDAQIEEEDRVFAEILLPLSRVIEALPEDKIDEFDDEMLDALNQGYDEVIILVRRYAWNYGIKVCPKETAVMYKHIRGEVMTEEEVSLYESVKDDAKHVTLFPGGLVILRSLRDNPM